MSYICGFYKQAGSTVVKLECCKLLSIFGLGLKLNLQRPSAIPTHSHAAAATFGFDVF